MIELNVCAIEGCKYNGRLHKHHIIFRSHGGLNIEMNYLHLCPEHHNMSSNSIHRNREMDLKFKRELQERYFKLFCEDKYNIKQIARLLNTTTAHIEKNFKKVQADPDGYIAKEDIIRKLMGGKLY